MFRESEEPVFSPESGHGQEEGAESGKELKMREMERLRQEVETRRRIEARLREKQEMEKKVRRKSSEKGKL